jgi:hypothetical protein
MPLYGSIPFKGRKWAPGVRVSGIDSPAEELIVDPNLVPQGSDPRYPNSDFIVIPRGRLVAMRADTSSYEGRAVLTLADGVDPANKPTTGYSGGNRPVGFTEANIFRKWQEHDQWTPTIERHGYIEVPYVPTINNAYGTLAAGDRITAYFGSVAATAPGVQDKGKLVKWVERKLYNHHQSTAASGVLASAIYPAFPPQVVYAAANGTVSTASVTLAWNGANWTFTMGDR